MAGFLVGITVVITADYGSAVLAAALVTVPEDLHQVTGHGAVPHVLGAPLIIGQVALIGRLAVTLATGTTVGCETVASAQFTH